MNDLIKCKIEPKELIDIFEKDLLLSIAQHCDCSWTFCMIDTEEIHLINLN